MDGTFFCGLSEHLETMEVRRSPRCKWWVRDGLSRVPRDVVRRTVTDAMAMWSSVANVQAVEADSEANADLVIQVASIDGRQGVLADCMLPGPRVQVCRLDDSEAWVVQLGPSVGNDVIDLDRVLRHELGHFWGLGHDRQGAQSLMAPTYSRAIYEAKDWDVQQIQALYGPPVNTAKPGQVPTYLVMYDADGHEMNRYRLTEIGQ